MGAGTGRLQGERDRQTSLFSKGGAVYLVVSVVEKRKGLIKGELH